MPEAKNATAVAHRKGNSGTSFIYRATGRYGLIQP
jgi:hypothetical protein